MRTRMRIHFVLCLVLASCRGLAGAFVPDTRTAADHAREIEPRCQYAPEATAVTLVAPAQVERVEPENSFVQSGNDRRANLSGARIFLFPMAGQSPETITRSLECHQARAALGRVEAQSDDPYVLPGRWLDIDVHSEGDGFSVRVTTDSIADAKKVLDRAQRHVTSTVTR
jgi:hypothetical protein